MICPCWNTKSLRHAFLAVLALSATTSHGLALAVEDYDPAVNARFPTGYPANPVPNTSPSFLAAGSDLSGIGWGATNTGQGYGFLSPQHFIYAQHFSSDSSIRFLGGDGSLHTYSLLKGENTGTGYFGDLAVGTLTESVSVADRMARYAIIDLNATSTANTSSNYGGGNVLVYGNGPAGPTLGPARIIGLETTPPQSFFITDRDDSTLQGGDSGSPTLAVWTNANGGSELTLIGNNYGVGNLNDGTPINAMNFLGSTQAINSLNALTTDDGRALRLVGEVAADWTGGIGSGAQRDDLVRDANWSSGSTPSDKFIRFDGATTTDRAVDVNAAANHRGLYFKSSAASDDGFTFSGGGTYTIGRGGITNYDADRQAFSAAIRLGDHQYWDGGAGGITAAAIDTNGKLLEVRSGAAAVRLTDAITGTGGIALDDGKLELTGISTYTGMTWVHAGELRVDGNIASSAALQLGAEGTLSGNGTVGLISGSGTVGPGASPGILTAAQVDPSGGLDFAFEFTTLGDPTFGNASASGNDLLRLTSVTPFTGAFTSANVISIYLDLPSLMAGDSFRGGFFTDLDVDFVGSLLAADFQYYVADASGPFSYLGKNYAGYDGGLGFLVSTTAASANFPGGTVAGRILNFSTLTPVPEPLTWGALGVLLGVGMARRRLRMRMRRSTAFRQFN